MFNLRGSDIDYNPVFFSYALVTLEDLYLFVDPSRVTDEILKHFEGNQVTVVVRKYEDIFDTFQKLIDNLNGKVWVSPTSSYKMFSMVPKTRRHLEITPVALMKAIKNEVEAQGMRNCHVRDGVALVQYFGKLFELFALAFFNL